MIRIILCEGETDLTLLGLYLEKMCGWIYERKPKLRIKIPQTFPAGNEKAETYKRGIEELIICCVGGKDKFGSFFEKYIHRIIVSSHDGETDFRIADRSRRASGWLYQKENSLCGIPVQYRLILQVCQTELQTRHPCGRLPLSADRNLHSGMDESAGILTDRS